MSLRALQGPTGGGAPVGGTGTSSPSTIPRWTGASTLGDSGLIDDSTSIYTSTRRVGVDTSTTLANVKLQVGTAASLANYQGAPLGVVLPAGSGSWLELAENSASGTSFRISKDSSTGVVLNTNGKTIGFTAAGYTTAVASSQVVLTTTGNVGIGVIPSAWASSVRAEEMRTHARWNYNSGSDSVAYWTVNAFLNSAGNAIYKATAAASQYTQIGGAHVWERAVSGTAGNTVTWLESARIDSAGNLGIGTASPTAALDVPASTTTRATLRVRSGVAPTAPNTGDVWFDGTSLFMRNGAGTQTVSFGGGGGATAWVNFNGTGVVTIRGDAGVSSVSDGGVGVYTVNFDSALSDANFAAPTSAWYEGVAAGAMGVTARTTTSVTLKTVATQTGALVDMLECHCAIFR